MRGDPGCPDGDCPACVYLNDLQQNDPGAYIAGKWWRSPVDYDDLRAAWEQGVPIHDNDGDCVLEITRPGWVAIGDDRAAAVYRIEREPTVGEFVRKIETFSIFTQPGTLQQPPTIEEQEAALESIRKSMLHVGLVGPADLD